METRSRTPLLVTVFALLTVLYPVVGARTPARTRESNPTKQTKALTSMSESQEGEPAKEEFPGAKDLVARFLFSRADEQANPTGKAGR